MTSDPGFPVSLPSGWDLCHEGGLIIARRQEKLSEYQRLNGAQAELQARESAELHILIDAQNRLVERVSLAESVARTLLAERTAGIHPTTRERTETGDGPSSGNRDPGQRPVS